MAGRARVAGPVEIAVSWPPTGCATLRRYPEEALRYVEQGRESGWEPNGDIYELLISWLCTTATSAPKAVAQRRQDVAGVAVFTDVENVRALGRLSAALLPALFNMCTVADLSRTRPQTRAWLHRRSLSSLASRSL